MAVGERPGYPRTTVTQAWEVAYRPHRFAQVTGQARAIKELLALIATRRIFQAVMVGPSGVGKTTLARIVAQFLNCIAARDHEPCGECRNCVNFEAGRDQGIYFELNAAEGLGNKDELREFIDDYLASPPPGSSCIVVFIDEAKSLTPQAQALLLKRMEDPVSRVIFIFALIDDRTLAPEFTARARTINLQAPTPEQIVEVVRRIALAEGVSITPEGEQLIACQSTSFRTATMGLQKVFDLAGPAEPITAEMVRLALYADRFVAVMSFMTAAVSGDLTNALAAIGRMHDSPSERLRNLQQLLVFIKKHHVAPIRVPPSATGHLLYDPNEIAALMKALGRNAARTSVSPADYFDRLLTYWINPPSTLTTEAFEIYATQFVDLCATLLVDNTSDSRVILHTLPLINEPYRSMRARRAPPVKTRLASSAGGIDELFLSARQARSIYEAATFLVQEYGVTFNAALLVDFSPLAIYTEVNAATLLTNLGRELAQLLPSWSGEIRSPISLHRLTSLSRRSDGNLNAQLLFHLPTTLEAVTRDWLIRWFGRYAAGSGTPVHVPLLEVPPASTDSRDAMDRHWRLIRRVLGGLDPRYMSGGLVPLIDRLKIPPGVRAPAGSIAGARFHTSETIGPGTRRKAELELLGHVSAWRASRFDQLYTGWEIREHREREALRGERAKFNLEIARRQAATGDPLARLILDQLAADERNRRNVAPLDRSRDRALWPLSLQIKD